MTSKYLKYFEKTINTILVIIECMKHTGLGKSPKHYVIYIEKGEKINKTIEEFCKSYGIVHAVYKGIGAIKNVEIAMYRSAQRDYVRKKFSGEYELISLIGNFGFVKNGTPEDKWFAHTHITFSDENFQCLGGHLDEAEVIAVVEVHLTAYRKKLIRKYNADIGLNIMDIHCNHGGQGGGHGHDCCGGQGGHGHDCCGGQGGGHGHDCCGGQGGGHGHDCCGGQGGHGHDCCGGQGGQHTPKL